MKTKTFSVLTVLLLGCAGQAMAMYNPQTGRFLSRDPRGELGFEVLQKASGAAIPHEGRVFNRQSSTSTFARRDQGKFLDRSGLNTSGLMTIEVPRMTGETAYSFVLNRPTDLIDPLGLVQWGTAVDTGTDGTDSAAGVDYHIYKVQTDAGNWVFVVKQKGGNEFFCHGLTFGGNNAAGGPFSPVGDQVPQIIADDGWKRICCGKAKPREDIVVFIGWGEGGSSTPGASIGIAHSAIVTRIQATSGQFDEGASRVLSKHGWHAAISTWSFTEEAFHYRSKYRCFTKRQNVDWTCCPKQGTWEFPYPSSP